MPLFETPKPKQFNYRPRFYDPEKERWEALKQKYADERALKALRDNPPQTEAAGISAEPDAVAATDADLEYFQRRVRDLDRQERSKLTWKDMFRKREMPQFHYTPRFAAGSDTAAVSTDEPTLAERRSSLKIRHRFDTSEPDNKTLKPVPAGRIMLYALLVIALLYWILS